MTNPDLIPVYHWTPSEEDRWANEKNKASFLETPKEVQNYYDQVTPEYEEYLKPGRYNGPSYAADAVKRHVQASDKIRILDVAAGTGMVGEELCSRGFSWMDALDPSQNMLDVAIQKNIYQVTFPEFIGTDKTSIDDDTYDVVVNAGAFASGHMPCTALDEMIRICKPGGLVVTAMREEFLTIVPEYRNLKPRMDEHVKKNAWQCLEITQVPCFAFDKPGAVFVYQVVVSGEPDQVRVINSRTYDE